MAGSEDQERNSQFRSRQDLARDDHVKGCHLRLDRPAAEGKHEGKRFTATVEATDSAHGTAESNAVTIEVDPGGVAPAGTNADDTVTELATGVYDRVFAWVTFAVVAGVAVSVLVAAFAMLATVRFPAPNATVTSPAQSLGPFADRAAGAIILLIAAIGGVVLLFGVWQAMLETRGRLRGPGDELPAKPGTAGMKRGAGSELVKAFAELADKLRRMRGSMASMLLGAGILALCLLFAVGLARGAHLDPGPSQSPSQSPSPSQSGTTTDEPTPSQSPSGGPSPSASPSRANG